MRDEGGGMRDEGGGMRDEGGGTMEDGGGMWHRTAGGRGRIHGPMRACGSCVGSWRSGGLCQVWLMCGLLLASLTASLTASHGVLP